MELGHLPTGPGKPAMDVYSLYTPRTPGLQRMPYEIMAYITSHLDIEEIFDLSLCSHHFQYLVREENFCKSTVMAKAPHALEAIQAIEAQSTKSFGPFSRALRRLVKRRRSLSQASPYFVGMVGLADDYLYAHGHLCYLIEKRPPRSLRILDLYKSDGTELVVDIQGLISTAIPKTASCRKYKFRLLYHADDVTTCLFSFALPTTEHWLLIFNARKQTVLTEGPLESTARIFVRNNKHYLYYGTHSEEGADGFRKWVIRGLNMTTEKWFDQKMHLSNLVGYEIGITVCFEIIDDHFYGLSNQASFEIEEVDWTSYYYCFRFRLEEPVAKKTQVMKKRDAWRRHHIEGPIDNRWGFLKLEKNEDSGEVDIIECRREWLVGQSGSRRTYYTKQVVFHEAVTGSGQQVDNDSQGSDNEWEVSDNDSQVSEPGSPGAGSSTAVGFIAKPSHIPLQTHIPHRVHRGDHSSVLSNFPRSQVFLSSYQQCCDTYLDLLDDSTGEDNGVQCLRLRTGYRRPTPASRLVGSSLLNSALGIDDQIKELYQGNEVFRWPPRTIQEPQGAAWRIHRALNPTNYSGCIVKATSDERFVIYATKSHEPNSQTALVLVSFDPGTNLAGMQRGGRLLGEKESTTLIGATESLSPYQGFPSTRAAKLSMEFTDKGKEIDGRNPTLSSPCVRGSSKDNPSTPTLGTPEEGGWAWETRAMHLDLLADKLSFAF
ncbi:hypothetical protein F4778DRAFT_157458 [Xylariomycetidae sp. FL2044]|nr:hypothetical protein F4778DRAFT_157458 [Xylariomycetidae sp. FL2044]